MLTCQQSTLPPSKNSNMLGWPIVVSIANACITWAFAIVPSLLGFSLLVRFAGDGRALPRQLTLMGHALANAPLPAAPWSVSK